jgi:1-acyl-sn-glycerol-3-phosphate acyltransferase
MSSLERVDLLSELESKYQVELDEDSFAGLATTGELENWLRRPEIAVGPLRPEKPLSEWARSAPMRWFRKAFQRFVAIPLYRHFLQLTVRGSDNLRGVKPPVIVIANHVSHLDVPTIYTALQYTWNERLTPAIMKDQFRAYFEPAGRSLKEIVTAWISYVLACGLYNAYPLPQQMPGTRRALEYTADLVNRGYCPIVFPEGLRSPDGTIQPFRSGIGMMAVRLRVPIVPVRISGLYEIYSVRDSWPRRGSIQVSVGPPLSFSTDVSYEAAARHIEEVLRCL